jgi:hypothetical protein
MLSKAGGTLSPRQIQVNQKKAKKVKAATGESKGMVAPSQLAVPGET